MLHYSSNGTFFHVRVKSTAVDVCYVFLSNSVLLEDVVKASRGLRTWPTLSRWFQVLLVLPLLLAGLDVNGEALGAESTRLFRRYYRPQM